MPRTFNALHHADHSVVTYDEEGGHQGIFYCRTKSRDSAELIASLLDLNESNSGMSREELESKLLTLMKQDIELIQIHTQFTKNIRAHLNRIEEKLDKVLGQTS